MKRRTLLSMTSAGALIGLNGYLPTVEGIDETTPKDDNRTDNDDAEGPDDEQTDDNQEDDNNQGNDEKSTDYDEEDPQELMALYEEDADSLSFETLPLGRAGGPEAVGGEDRVELQRIATAGKIPDLYGFVLNSEEDTEQIDYGTLNEFINNEKLKPEDGDQPSDFIDNTVFDSESVVLLRWPHSRMAASIEVEYVGTVSDDTTYMRITRSGGPGERLSEGLTLTRVEESSIPEEVVVGDIYKKGNGSTADAVHTNQEVE